MTRLSQTGYSIIFDPFSLNAPPRPPPPSAAAVDPGSQISILGQVPKPLPKRIESISFATLSSDLKGGVHDRSFKQHLMRVLSMRLYVTPYEVLGRVPPEVL